MASGSESDAGSFVSALSDAGPTREEDGIERNRKRRRHTGSGHAVVRPEEIVDRLKAVKVDHVHSK